MNNAQSTSPATVNGKSFWRKFDNEVVLGFRVGLEKLPSLKRENVTLLLTYNIGESCFLLSHPILFIYFHFVSLKNEIAVWLICLASPLRGVLIISTYLLVGKFAWVLNSQSRVSKVFSSWLLQMDTHRHIIVNILDLFYAFCKCFSILWKYHGKMTL